MDMFLTVSKARPAYAMRFYGQINCATLTFKRRDPIIKRRPSNKLPRGNIDRAKAKARAAKRQDMFPRLGCLSFSGCST
ncbi:hypothetical protein HZ326_14306 [Fusarium oxysporum f. sp. albedinis]|nr:hypothetical protein HZ326_14306 [Fusarium oxysporum f. sp. albedinis]